MKLNSSTHLDSLLDDRAESVDRLLTDDRLNPAVPLLLRLVVHLGHGGRDPLPLPLALVGLLHLDVLCREVLRGPG